jgi:hypothetical protein
MTLQYQLESIDGLEESISKLYIEKDGKFILDVTGHEKPVNKDLIPKSRLDQEISKRKEAEKGLQTIVDQMVEDIPEDKRGIIPDLAPSAKITWLREGKKQGIFEDRKAESIDSKRPGDQQPKNFENMTPTQIMSTGYKSM